jgi:hypothetical protein
MRRNDWLTAQTFQRTQELLSAITELSVYSKLKMRGHPQRPRMSLDESRSVILSFLERLTKVISQSRSTPRGLVLGADPELGALARKYLATSSHPGAPSREVPELERLRELLSNPHSTDERELTELLSTLRRAIEENAHAGFTAVLGEV